MFLVIAVFLSAWRFMEVYLSTRNRPAASSSDGQPSKKPALSDSCPSDGEDVKGNCGKSLKPLCSQSSINSKEGIVCGAYNDAEMRD